MGKRPNDESGKKQPPKPKHARRGGQIKEDLAAMRDRLDVMNARLGSLCAAEQDLKLARQECAEGARLLGEMTKERDMAVRAKVQAIPSDSKIICIGSPGPTSPSDDPGANSIAHIIAKELQKFCGDPLVVFCPEDFKIEAMTDRELERIGLCRISKVAEVTK